MDDLLSALMGFGGQFIHFSANGSDSLPMALKVPSILQSTVNRAHQKYIFRSFVFS